MMAFRSSLAVFLIAVFSLAALAEEHAGQAGAARAFGTRRPLSQRHRAKWTGCAVPSAARFRHRACDRDPGREACLHGDGRHVLAVRPIRRTFGRDLLYGLCCQDERQDQRPGAAGDVRVQWRARSGLGFSQSRARRSAHRGVRQRLRRRARSPHRQPGHLARFHRSRDDRSGRHRLEPGRQA